MAEFITSTRKKSDIVPADEKMKDQFRQEYRKQDKETPFRLFVASPGKPKAHLFRSKAVAKEGFAEYQGVCRILMDMRNGNIIEYSNK